MDEDVIIGMDPHKASNTSAVLDLTEKLLTRRRFENSDDGFVEMLAAVADYPNPVCAVEGASGVGRSIAQSGKRKTIATDLGLQDPSLPGFFPYGFLNNVTVSDTNDIYVNADRHNVIYEF